MGITKDVLAYSLERKRAKYVDIRHHFVRENIFSGNVQHEHISPAGK